MSLFTRREVIGIFAAAIAGGAAGLESIIHPPLTDHQRKAIEQFNHTPREQRLHNLIVGEYIGNLRNTPDTSFENSKGANITNELKPGTIVSEAILVSGDDPDHPYERGLTGDWYFIPGELDDQGYTKSGAFAYSGDFKK